MVNVKSQPEPQSHLYLPLAAALGESDPLSQRALYPVQVVHRARVDGVSFNQQVVGNAAEYARSQFRFLQLLNGSDHGWRQVQPLNEVLIEHDVVIRVFFSQRAFLGVAQVFSLVYLLLRAHFGG